MEQRILVFLAFLAVMLVPTALAVVALYFRHKRRELAHRERMAAIEKNLQLPESFFEPAPAPPPRTPHMYLLRGLIWIAVGAPLVVFFLGMAAVEPDKELIPVAAWGLIPIGVGLAYLVVYRKESAEKLQEPGLVEHGNS